MSPDDLETKVGRFASDYPVILVMCDLAAKSEFYEFDRAAVANVTSTRGLSEPRTLKRFCDAEPIHKGSRPTGRRGQIYYTMPDHAEIRPIIDMALAEGVL